MMTTELTRQQIEAMPAGRGMFFGGGPEQVMTVTIGDWTMAAPVCVGICRAALLAATEAAGESQ
jgi:hypothetical protein